MQFLGHLETHNEKEFDRISKAIVDNYDTIIKSVIESRIQILEAIQSSEGRLTERLNQLEGSNRGGYQVSYVIKVKNLNIIETLSKLVSALNVQLMQNNQEIPFVPFNSFDSTQQGKNLFLYGRSGAGKSRSILEIMRTHLGNYKKIYLINPAKVLGEKTFREDISHLVAKFNGQDAVIWDNFPLDLTHRSSEGAKEALEIVSFTNANKVIVSLNPTYPETYKKMSFELPEITSIEIIYTKENIKDILKMYGERIDAFQELYQRYIQPNINTIATILWQKEPTPLIVFEYLKHLYAMQQKLLEGISTSVSEAKQLYPMINFYENQLKHLRRPQHSNPNLHFLYTLKLCYDLGLARNFDLLQQLQDSIFQSRVPTEPSYELSSWIYLSGSYYSMHDIPKEAIQFSPDILLKMTNYLKENPQVMLGDDQTLYQSGVFIGKNLQYLISET